jgi:hypothetical protein
MLAPATEQRQRHGVRRLLRLARQPARERSSSTAREALVRDLAAAGK